MINVAFICRCLKLTSSTSLGTALLIIYIFRCKLKAGITVPEKVPTTWEGLENLEFPRAYSHFSDGAPFLR